MGGFYILIITVVIFLLIFLSKRNESYSIKIHKKLNKNFWNHKGKLKSYIRKRILEIVGDFLEYIDYDQYYSDG